MYHIFICKLKKDIIVNPTEMDDMQLKSEWIDSNNLSKIHLLPSFLNHNILEMISSEIPKFFGSEHIPYNHA